MSSCEQREMVSSWPKSTKRIGPPAASSAGHFPFRSPAPVVMGGTVTRLVPAYPVAWFTATITIRSPADRRRVLIRDWPLHCQLYQSLLVSPLRSAERHSSRVRFVHFSEGPKRSRAYFACRPPPVPPQNWFTHSPFASRVYPGTATLKRAIGSCRLSSRKKCTSVVAASSSEIDRSSFVCGSYSVCASVSHAPDTAVPSRFKNFTEPARSRMSTSRLTGELDPAPTPNTGVQMG